MRSEAIQRVFGLLMMSFSLTLLPPIGVSLWYQDNELKVFLFALCFMLVVGSACWFPKRKAERELFANDGFIITVLFWVTLSLVSALPFLFSPHLDFSQSVFEAISGFTTTGATVITGLDNLPPSILYYRQQLHWFGGLGVIVFAIAVLPMLGIGGMQLYRAEAAGPLHDDKLMPRFKHVAMSSISVYVALTVTCVLAYWWGGMSLFDAVGHSYATVATGGFSTHDASLGYFASPFIETTAIIFMALSSLNFAIHFIAWHRLKFDHYWYDEQGRVFILIVFVLIAMTVGMLLWEGVYTDFWTALRYGSFHLVSVISTTGFTTTDFSAWPPFIVVLVFGSGFIGGCLGSTAGGFRVIRLLLLHKQAMRGIMRLIHPKAVIVIKVGQRRVSNEVAETVWEFTVLYIGSLVLLSMLFLLVTHVDILTAFSGVATCLNMVGPGLGQVTSNFSGINDAGLWVLSFTMLLGRLEIFTLLVVLTPAFWRS